MSSNHNDQTAPAKGGSTPDGVKTSLQNMGGLPLDGARAIDTFSVAQFTEDLTDIRGDGSVKNGLASSNDSVEVRARVTESGESRESKGG